MQLGEAVLVTGAVLVLGGLDYAKPYDLSSLACYVVPVALVAARHGAAAGHLVSGLCAVTWFTADALAHPDLPPWRGVWTAATGVVAFAVVAHTVGRVRRLGAAARPAGRTLRGLLPICTQCKQIRDDQGRWQPLEAYLAQHADVQFSHGLCDPCLAATLREVATMRSAARAQPPIPIPVARPSDADT